MIGALIMNLLSVFYSYFSADKAALRATNSIPIDLKTREGQKLKMIVSDLAHRMNILEPRIYITHSPAINAFATGRNQEHAAVSVSSGAIQKLNDNELRGVLAHELSHIKNRDILVSSIIIAFTTILVTISKFMFYGNSTTKGNKNILVILFVMVVSFLAPIAAMVVRATVSRKREYMADMGSAIVTEHPEYLASALEKIKMDEEKMRGINPAVSHLFIANPFKADIGGTKLKFLEKLFADHPPLDKRIAILRKRIK